MMVNPLCSIFFGLNKKQLRRLLASAEVLSLQKDTVFIEEDVIEHTFFFIKKGCVSVFRKIGAREQAITLLNKKESVGELALIDNKPRSASVKCVSDCILYRFNIEALKKDPNYADIYALICKNLNRQLSQRLRYTNDITLSALKSKFAISIFSVRVLITLALYTLSLSLLSLMKNYFSNTTLISLGLIIIFALVLLSIILQSGYSLKQYGFSLKKPFHIISESIILSFPIMAVIVLIKWLAINYFPHLHNFPLFDPTAIFTNGTMFNLNTYLLALLGYSIFCPVQEFIVRGCIQTSFQQLMTGTKTSIKWKAIIVSNLLFASTHSHTSLGFSLIVFLPGLFWGWLFYRQKSLVGVSISHILIGVWAAFIVGFENII